MARVRNILSKLPSWWNKSGNTYSILNSMSKEIDDIDNEKVNLVNEIRLETATGQQLDDIGKIFKLSRKPNESDAQFRARIKAFYPGFSGGGTKPSIKDTVERITGIQPTLVEYDTLKFRCEFTVNGLSDLVNTTRETVINSKAAGAYVTFLVDGNYSDSITVSENYQIVSSNVIIAGSYIVGSSATV